MQLRKVSEVQGQGVLEDMTFGWLSNENGDLIHETSGFYNKSWYVCNIHIYIYMHVWSRLFLGTVFSVGKNGKLRWVDHGGGHEQRIHIIYIIYIYM
jgi:hypothetical protein